jgi:hypothetical protein
MKGIGGNVDFAINMSFLTRIASGLGNMGKAAEEMALKMKLGKASVTDLAEEVAKKIPIFGNFITAGRAIRELITGEQAYTEVLKAQTEAQNDRIKAVNGWIEAMKRLGRRGEDLGRDLGPPGFGKDFAGIAAGVARQTEDLPDQLEKEFEKQFSDFAAQRKALGEKLRNLQGQNVPHAVGTGATGGGGFIEQPSLQIGKDIEATQRSIDKIDEMSRALRAAEDKVKDLGTKDINLTGLRQLENLLGATFTKGLKSATAAIDQFIPKLPKLSPETQQAISAAGGKLLDFQNKMAAFRADLGKGLISQGTFDKISFNTLNKDFGADFWKAMGESVANGFGQFQAAVDPKLGGLISTVRERMNNLLRTFGIGPKLSPAGVSDNTPTFRSSTIGLEDLGRRLGEGAAGGDQTQEGILKAVQDSLKEQERQTALLKTLGTVK